MKETITQEELRCWDSYNFRHGGVWHDKKTKTKCSKKFLLRLAEKENYGQLSLWFEKLIEGRRESSLIAIFACEMVLPIWEDKFPDDKRPHKAIKAVKKYLKKPSHKNRIKLIEAQPPYNHIITSLYDYIYDAVYDMCEAPLAIINANATYGYRAINAAHSACTALLRIDGSIKQGWIDIINYAYINNEKQKENENEKNCYTR